MVGDYMRLPGGECVGVDCMRLKVGGNLRRCCVWSMNTRSTVLEVGRRMDRTRERLDAFDVGSEF